MTPGKPSCDWCGRELVAERITKKVLHRVPLPDGLHEIGLNPKSQAKYTPPPEKLRWPVL